MGPLCHTYTHTHTHTQTHTPNTHIPNGNNKIKNYPRYARKERESNSNNKGSHQIVREKSKRKETKMNYKEKPKSTNEMAGRIYLLIITLNVNGLNAPVKDIEWPNGYEKKA